MIKQTVTFEMYVDQKYSYTYEFVSADEQVEEVEWVLKKYTEECVLECEGIFRHLGLGEIIDDLKTYGMDLALALREYDYEPIPECKSLRDSTAISSIVDQEERAKVKKTVKEFVSYKVEKIRHGDPECTVIDSLKYFKESEEG